MTSPTPKPPKMHWIASLQGLFPQTETPVPPEMAQAMGTLLGHYSEKVIAEVCGPEGICTKEEFFPSIAKLKTYLDEARERELRPRELSERAKRQLEERKKFDLEMLIKRENNPTYEELKAKYGENWGIDQGLRRPATDNWGVRFNPEKLKEIPDLPPGEWQKMPIPGSAKIAEDDEPNPFL